MHAIHILLTRKMLHIYTLLEAPSKFDVAHFAFFDIGFFFPMYSMMLPERFYKIYYLRALSRTASD